MSLTPFVHAPGAVLARDVPVPLDAETLHHLRAVRRCRDGARVMVADGVDTAAPARLRGDAVVIDVAAATKEGGPRLEVWQGLGKGSRNADATRLATEAGAAAVRLVLTERGVRRPDPAAARRLVERCAAVARSAASQSRRPSLPVVDGVHRLDLLLDGAVEPPRYLVAGVAGDPPPTTDPLAAVVLLDPLGPPATHGTAALAALTDALASAPRPRIAVVVGPEGGHTQGELDELRDRGAIALGLPTPILRTEHAAMAGIVALRSALGLTWRHVPLRGRGVSTAGPDGHRTG